MESGAMAQATSGSLDSVVPLRTGTMPDKVGLQYQRELSVIYLGYMDLGLMISGQPGRN